VLDDRAALVREALAHGWYHTIDVAPGVATPGAVDLRALAPRVLPRRLDGLRALDVGTFDGFWAFALERRGAAVVATDLDRFDELEWPPQNRAALAAEAGERGPGERFDLARRLLGSQVRRVAANVYDLDAALVGGPADYAVAGDLLLHLRDPVAALERVRGVLVPGGRLLSLEQVSVPLTLLRPRRPAAAFQAGATRMNWWEPNVRALLAWLRIAGFAGARVRRVYRLRAHGAQARWHVALEARA
jgi:SAM-dependent methyltransferase